MKTNYVIYVLVAIAFVAGVMHLFTKDNVVPVNGGSNHVACTEDAMMCPDGSYVGRTGANCEFVCPEVEGTQTATHPMISVYDPTPNTTITNPLQFSGEATGPWYFEASAPVELLD